MVTEAQGGACQPDACQDLQTRLDTPCSHQSHPSSNSHSSQQVKASSKGTELATALGEEHQILFRPGPGGGTRGAMVWAIPGGSKTAAHILETIQTCRVRWLCSGWTSPLRADLVLPFLHAGTERAASPPEGACIAILPSAAEHGFQR